MIELDCTVTYERKNEDRLAVYRLEWVMSSDC
jgi:hypothetical protein